MNKKHVIITVTLNEKNFISEFDAENHVPEYMIADDAYRLALMYAKTQFIAQFGYFISDHKFADFLKNLDYEYAIKEAQ